MEGGLFPCFTHNAGTSTSPEGRRAENFVELPAQLSTKMVDLKSVAVNLVHLKGLPRKGVPAVLEEEWWDQTLPVFMFSK